MYILIDKTAIFICSFILLLFYAPALNFYSVFLCLAAFTLSCLSAYLNPNGKCLTGFKKNILLFFVPASYIFLCLLLPEGFMFLPLIFYDILFFRFLAPYFLCLAAYAYLLFSFDAPIGALLLLLSSLSVLLHHKSLRILALERQIKTIRDNSTEYQLILAQKNRDLLEKQDYEIYLATLKERNRIAREIHDNVGHMLSRSILQSGALIAVNRDAQMTQPLYALKDTLSCAMDNIRESVHDLHDDSVDLKASVTQLLETYTQYRIHFDYDMGRILPREIKYCFISVTREALSNIVKHSNAGRIEILMREQPRIYHLTIIDDGTDIAIEDSGIGLAGMQERVQLLNGTLTIHTENGFRIFISIPKGEFS